LLKIALASKSGSLQKKTFRNPGSMGALGFLWKLQFNHFNQSTYHTEQGSPNSDLFSLALSKHDRLFK
jgi:hypothetical protein